MGDGAGLDLNGFVLGDGSQAVDHLGRDVTVFVLGSSPEPVSHLVEEALASGRAIRVVRVPFADAAEQWGGRVVLADAAGAVLWRGAVAPVDLSSIPVSRRGRTA